MQVLTVSLALVLGFICIGAGVAFSQDPKLGQLERAIVADLFLTLGFTGIVGALTTCFPRVPVFRSLADKMFRKLCILGVLLAILFFVLLIFI